MGRTKDSLVEQPANQRFASSWARGTLSGASLSANCRRRSR
jgi:hypothetical protein